MRFIILEGISTSGKTTLQKLLVESLQVSGSQVICLSEKQTVANILEGKKTVDESKAQLMSLLDSISNNTDYVICDRFHFAHCGSLHCSLDSFREIETRLSGIDTAIVMLWIDEEDVVLRIRNLLEHRDTPFQEHVNKIIAGSQSQEEEDEKLKEFYHVRIEKYRECIHETKLPVLMCSVNEDYEQIVKKILER